MTEYLMVEIANQQQFREGPHMALTPRIEYENGETYTNLNDFKAVLAASQSAGEIVFNAEGRLLTASRQPVPGGDIGYRIAYRMSDNGVEIVASTVGRTAGSAPIRLIVPVIVRDRELAAQVDSQTVRIAKAKGTLAATTDATAGFEAGFKEKTFNLVPGFEAVPLAVLLAPNREVRIRLQAS
jgi:hypothetical protein